MLRRSDDYWQSKGGFEGCFFHKRATKRFSLVNIIPQNLPYIVNNNHDLLGIRSYILESRRLCWHSSLPYILNPFFHVLVKGLKICINHSENGSAQMSTAALEKFLVPLKVLSKPSVPVIKTQNPDWMSRLGLVGCFNEGKKRRHWSERTQRNVDSMAPRHLHQSIGFSTNTSWFYW